MHTRFASFIQRYSLILLLAMFLVACRAQTSVVPSLTNTPESHTATLTRLPSVTTTHTATAVATDTPTAAPSTTHTPTLTFTPTITPTPYPPERLAFAVGPEESPAIAFINSDGSGYERADYFGPYMFVNTESQSHMTGDFLASSPDGRYLAFDGSEFAWTSSVYLADLSSREAPISIPDTWGTPAAWSPDSQYLVVTSDTLYTDTQGSLQTRVNLRLYNVHTKQFTWLTDSKAKDFFPSWSPDGQWIAFSRMQEDYPVYPCVNPDAGCDGLYIIHPDGDGLKFLTGNVFFSFMDRPYWWTWIPAWSPDQKWLSATSAESREKILVNTTSGEIKRLGYYTYERFAWTPDGYLYAILAPSGDVDIFSLHPDGSGRVNLTNSPGIEISPVWSPSGHFVAFYYYYAEQYFLCVMYSDGSGRHCIEGLKGKRIAWLPVKQP